MCLHLSFQIDCEVTEIQEHCLIMFNFPRTYDSDMHLSLDDCVIWKSAPYLLWLVFINSLDDLPWSLTVSWSLTEVPIHISWLTAILVGLSLFSHSLICCHLTPWQLNIPHGALPPNYNTHFAGQVIILPSKLPPHLTNFVCVPQGRILI